MSCVTASVGCVYFVRWVQRPEVADMRLIVRELTERHQALGRPLTYVALAPESSEPPDNAARSHMPTLMNQALVHCEIMHLVFEGVGFKHSVMRSVMAAVFLAGGKRERVRVHARVEDIVHEKASQEIAQALRILALRGLLTDLPSSGKFQAARAAY
jgi:hypothetical protein